MVEDVTAAVRSSILALKPKFLEESVKPKSFEWLEKPHFFFWGLRKWRCTIKEDRKGDIKIYLIGFQRNSETVIKNRLSIQYIVLKLRPRISGAKLLVFDPPKKLRRHPYKRPRGRVFNPFLGKMVRRSTRSKIRAHHNWEARESERKSLFESKRIALEKLREARRSKRLALYEAACRERERIWKEKGIDEDFGRSKQWQKARKQVIKEWQGVCAVCCLKIEGLIHIHHIHPKGKFPEKALEFENLAPVHAPCHAKIHSSKPAKVHGREMALKRFLKTAESRPNEH